MSALGMNIARPERRTQDVVRSSRTVDKLPSASILVLGISYEVLVLGYARWNETAGFGQLP